MKQIVYPIKDSVVLEQVQDCLLNSFEMGRRNYTIFQVGKATLLRVSDVLRLKYSDVFDENGKVKDDAYIHDRKTGKPNTLYLEPVKDDLLKYKKWLYAHEIHSVYLFPNRYTGTRVNEKQFYKIMHKVGELLGINYLGTHTMRKTGAYRVYIQSGYNIGLVMDLLNHSSQSMTLHYLGLDTESKRNMLNKINFG
ncbi:tyrosine-type recombinase/integrase [Apilactobacillus micheneri]|uniref:tyrosine-type recombinase/integrase n=1 Tax=Apilactobacillus micheneri TaxID=1899430 RepID=UPI000D028A2E|nr:tyrosine-type recombinase/integrase [Apilactobacillus micheneri]